MCDTAASSLFAGLDGLEHAKAGLLDVGNGGVLLLLERLILGLELLDLGLEGGLGVSHGLLTLGDLGSESGVIERHSGLNFGLLGSITEVEVGRAT